MYTPDMLEVARRAAFAQEAQKMEIDASWEAAYGQPDPTEVAAQVEACWSEEFVDPELEAMLAVTGIANQTFNFPVAAPRRIDSATHRAAAETSAAADKEDSPLKPKPAPETNRWGEPMSERDLERHNRDERQRILEAGRASGRFPHWGARTTPEEATDADKILRNRKPNNQKRLNRQAEERWASR